MSVLRGNRVEEKINVITVIMLVGCAPQKEESDKKNNYSEQDKNNDKNIKLKVGSEEDDVKKDEKK